MESRNEPLNPSSEVYKKITDSGAKVNWYKDRGSVAGLNIDLGGYSADDQESLQAVIDQLTSYISLPAIVDNFKKDADRKSWLMNTDPEVQRAYDQSRLRNNKITTVTASLALVTSIFEDTNNPGVKECESLRSKVWKAYEKEDKTKIKLSFADELASKALEVLKLLEK